MADPTQRSYVTTSWDDGHIYDFAVANLLESHGLPGTFYIAPRNHELPARSRLRDADIQQLATRFEIGGHTLTHQRLAGLSDQVASQEIRGGKSYLEDCIGEQIHSFCYPGGSYRPEQTCLVAEAGFSLARTVVRHRTDLNPAPLEVPTTFHAYQHLLDGPAAWAMSHRRPTIAARWFFGWDDWAIAMFDGVVRDGGVFHLWGHSWELEDRKDWDRLERVLDHIAHRDDVTYVSNRDLISLPVGGLSHVS
jgi:peptidoglycan/xylan/chitin deacetylase (PgdA/CDA1 family)